MARLSSIAGDYSNAGTIIDRQQITAVGGETRLPLVFIDGAEEVYLNGSRLMKGADREYTTEKGLIVLTTPLAAQDEVLLIGRASSNEIPFSKSVSESIVLTADGQTELQFTSIETEGMELYVSGILVDRGRLTSPQDYELRENSSTIVDLTHTYPVGTIIEGVQGGRLSFVDADSLVVNDGETSKSLASRFADTQASRAYFIETNGTQLQELQVGLSLTKWRVDYMTGVPSLDSTGKYPVLKLGKSYWNPSISASNLTYTVVDWDVSGDGLTVTASDNASGDTFNLSYYRRTPNV